MLQLAAAAPGLCMPLFVLRLKTTHLKIKITRMIVILVIVATYPKSCDLNNLLVWVRRARESACRCGHSQRPGTHKQKSFGQHSLTVALS